MTASSFPTRCLPSSYARLVKRLRPRGLSRNNAMMPRAHAIPLWGHNGKRSLLRVQGHQVPQLHRPQKTRLPPPTSLPAVPLVSSRWEVWTKQSNPVTHSTIDKRGGSLVLIERKTHFFLCAKLLRLTQRCVHHAFNNLLKSSRIIGMQSLSTNHNVLAQGAKGHDCEFLDLAKISPSSKPPLPHPRIPRESLRRARQRPPPLPLPEKASTSAKSAPNALP